MTDFSERILVVKRRISVRMGIRQAASLNDAPHNYQLITAADITASKLRPYLEQVIGDHQRGFRRNRSTGGILEEKMGIQWRGRGCICSRGDEQKLRMNQTGGFRIMTSFSFVHP